MAHASLLFIGELYELVTNYNALFIRLKPTTIEKTIRVLILIKCCWVLIVHMLVISASVPKSLF